MIEFANTEAKEQKWWGNKGLYRTWNNKNYEE